MIDANAAILAYLNTQAGITSLTSTRIYWPRLPENWPTASQAGIMFSNEGGDSDPELDHIEPSVQFNCYGATSEQARQVYRALHDALEGIQHQAMGQAVCLWAEETVHGQDLIDPDTGWPFVLSIFRFRFQAN